MSSTVTVTNSPDVIKITPVSGNVISVNPTQPNTVTVAATLVGPRGPAGADGSAAINDSTSSLLSTYSSAKIDELIATLHALIAAGIVPVYSALNFSNSANSGNIFFL